MADHTDGKICNGNFITWPYWNDPYIETDEFIEMSNCRKLFKVQIDQPLHQM